MCDCGCATWSHLQSPMHRLPAGVKIGAAVSLVLLLVLVPPRAWWLAGVAAGLGVAVAKSGIPARFFVRRLLMLEPVVLSVAMLPLLEGAGWVRVAAVVGRSTLCIAALVLLANTTPLSESLPVLRRLRVPGVMVTTMALMCRYLHVLHEESVRMRGARAARTFGVRRGGAWRDSAAIAGRLFVRSTVRSERIYAAMCARGWR